MSADPYQLPRLRPVGDWTQYAACKGMDLSIFFPERGQSTAEAEAVCRVCPVRVSCLKHATTTPERHGVWGGLPERARTLSGRVCERCDVALVSGRARYCEGCRVDARAETVARHYLVRTS